MSDTTSIVRKGLLCACAAVLTAAPLLGLTGCRRDPQQVQITTGSEVRTGLTPTERGKIRREALRVAEKGLSAWQSGDPTAMKPYWGATYVTYFEKTKKAYAAKGQKRVYRFGKIDQFDVSDMNDAGTQVTVDILAVDQGHVETASGAQVTKPRNASAYMQLTMDKKNGAWVISRLIAGKEVTE